MSASGKCAKCGHDKGHNIHRSSLYPGWHLFVRGK